MHTKAGLALLLALAPLSLGQIPDQVSRLRPGPPDVVPVWCSGAQTLDLWTPAGTLASSTPLSGPANLLACDRFGYLWMAGPAGVLDTLYRIDLRSNPPRIAEVVPLAITHPQIRIGDGAIAPDDHLWIVDQTAPGFLELDSRGRWLADYPISSSQPQTAGLAVAPTTATSKGYFLWLATYDTSNGATTTTLRVDPTGQFPDFVRTRTNQLVLNVAIGAGGNDVYLPVNQGSSNADDRLEHLDANGQLIDMIVATGWAGTASVSAIAAANDSVWVSASDGHSSGGFNPKVVFRYHAPTQTFLGWNAASASLPSGISEVTLDGLGNCWVSVTATSELFQVDGSTLVTTSIPCCGSGQTEHDATGYVLANVIYPDLDFDGDGIPNRQELLSGSNPFE